MHSMAPTSEKESLSLDAASEEMDNIHKLVAEMGTLLKKSGNYLELERELLKSLSLVSAALESRRPAKPDEGSRDVVMLMGSPCSNGGRSESFTGKRKKAGGATDKKGNRRRRSQSWWPVSVINSGTLFDGHTWRKYGQKAIQSSNFPRSYYRCTHKYTRNCHAIRHAQQTEDDPSTYTITYIGEHTCKTASSKPTHQPKASRPATAAGGAKVASGPTSFACNLDVPKLEPSLSPPAADPPQDDVVADPNGREDTQMWDLDSLEISLPMTEQSSDSGGSEIESVTSVLRALGVGSDCLGYLDDDESLDFFRFGWEGTD